ncbi:nicotinate phosphoribosyltransferase [Annulohypoxylon truncatum]|uniref:nicotinate phosphoribosyltransferase n=1 Tax=Annulohypoxylon truncatum TaxID=327061 RepID=UPI002007A547|nr:nicotinate phosphoribosyltransferase [Annulohypoxylon truncatum]KAI1209597.1 nicotinate phosphoribosyltransferase [Annulohypoxylon truncatum]
MDHFDWSTPFPEGVISFLDTDLYKLTMQCAVFKHYPDVSVSYAFTNRTPEKKLSRKAFSWLCEQISKLGNISLSDDELRFLQSHCKYLSTPYLNFLKEFRLKPREQLIPSFYPIGADTGAEDELGDIHIEVRGKWVDTILYEIPLLALTSEAYFKFMDKDWNYDGQEDKAYGKGMRLLEAGCIFSEFGTRRRRDYHTQALVFRGLVKAGKEAEKRGLPGKLSGTSNVHLAMRFNLAPVGTVAHEWFMGVAAITNDYLGATEEALRRWIGCFGEGVLGIALTDTFGTPEFLRSFSKPVRYLPDTPNLPVSEDGTHPTTSSQSYAEVFSGVRQDSGDPATFVKLMREFYDKNGIEGKKTIVFSDSLDIDKCIEYKRVSEEHGFQPTFGVGTYLTNDFTQITTGKKSVPLNIVIKLSSAAGNSAIKISDNIGKNTGDSAKVAEVKKLLGYVEKEWAGGDETSRWGKPDDVQP